MAEGGLDLAFDLVAGEQRHVALVELDLAEVLRHHLAHEVAGLVIDLFLVDQDFADVLAEVVADGADDDVAVLVDEHRRGALSGGAFDGAPELQQVVQIPLQLLSRLADAGRAYDEPHTRRHVETAQDLAQIAALVAFHAPRDAARTGIVRHQHQIAPGKTREGRERGALGATLLLLDLHDELLALAERILDACAAPRSVTLTLPVGEVLPGHLLEGQEAVPLGAVIDEGRLEARLDARDFSLVDAGFLLGLRRNLDVQIVQILAVDHGDPQLFGLGRVYQHSFHAKFTCQGTALVADNGHWSRGPRRAVEPHRRRWEGA